MADLHIIRIEDAKALVQVGVPDPERAAPQEVRISVALALDEPPDYVRHDRPRWCP
jgi:dihydroneopterin aldolase